MGLSLSSLKLCWTPAPSTRGALALHPAKGRQRGAVLRLVLLLTATSVVCVGSDKCELLSLLSCRVALLRHSVGDPCPLSSSHTNLLSLLVCSQVLPVSRFWAVTQLWPLQCEDVCAWGPYLSQTVLTYLWPHCFLWLLCPLSLPPPVFEDGFCSWVQSPTGCGMGRGGSCIWGQDVRERGQGQSSAIETLHCGVQ